MTTFEDLKQYSEGREFLISVTPTFSIPKDDPDGGLVNTKLVEVYRFPDEQLAGEAIEEAKKNNDFFAVQKKYRAEKVNKKGETVREAYYQVKIVYKTQY